MNKWIKGLIVAWCSTGVTLAAAATRPSADLEELEAVVVYGQKFEERVLESEERFYRRYNELNANDEFDVSCEYFWLEDRSLAVFGPGFTRRGCVPMFFAEAMASNHAWLAAVSSASCNSSGSYYGGSMRVQYGDGGPVGYAPMIGIANSSYEGSYSTLGVPYNGSCSASFAPAPPEARLVYMSRRDDFVANLQRVLRSEPELRMLAFETESLAEEGKEHLKAAAKARRQLVAARPCIPRGSPRTGMSCARR